MPRNQSRQALMLMLLLAGALTGACGKVPSPDQIFGDQRAQHMEALCMSWGYSTPRKTLTEAAHGDDDRKTLAVMLLREWREDDPEELRDAYAKLQAAAKRLQRGDDGDTVLREAEVAMAETDRFHTQQCPIILKASGSTITTGPR